MLGSNLNPILTQLAKTRRAVFVEGKDFQIFSRFTSQLSRPEVASRADFAVVPVEGFSPERVKNIKAGIETTLGTTVSTAAIFDRDYRSAAECIEIEKKCTEFCDLVVVHSRKEVENFLLVSTAIDRSAASRVADQNKRTGSTQQYEPCAAEVLDAFSADKKAYIAAQFSAERIRFERQRASRAHEATINEAVFRELEVAWTDGEKRLEMVPGKEALSALNQRLQKKFQISVTPTSIVNAMTISEIPEEMKSLINRLSDFVRS